MERKHVKNFLPLGRRGGLEKEERYFRTGGRKYVGCYLVMGERGRKLDSLLKEKEVDFQRGPHILLVNEISC